jgi:large subunit ribosomal protein L30
MAKEVKVKVTQTRSIAGREPGTKRTAAALGLGKIGKSKMFTMNPALEGMLRRVRHLVEVVEVK